MFKVTWTGAYPNLCCGKWIISKDGQNVSNLIPKDLLHSPMGTFGEYTSWHFENWIEVFESYNDGLSCEDWIRENTWIYKICTNKKEAEELYSAIQAQDWRHGSCGGCI